MELPDGLSAHLLQRDRFYLALPDDHRLAGVSSLRRLAHDRFIVPEQELGARELGRIGGFTPRIGATPADLLTVLTEVSMRASVPVLPEVVNAADSLLGVVSKPLAGSPITSDLAAVFRRTERSPAARN